MKLIGNDQKGSGEYGKDTKFKVKSPTLTCDLESRLLIYMLCTLSH